MKTMTIAIGTAAAALAAGCGQSACETDTCETRVVVAKNIAFALEQEGVTEGFDLDGVVSRGDDRDSCFQTDYVAPDGREGIDNQFAVLWAAITDVIDDAVDGLLRGAINDGNLLFMIELVGVDDPVNDGCVDVNIYLGAGMPDIGTDGYITSGQTFDIGSHGALSQVPCAALRDGVIEAGPFDGMIPISILDVAFDLRIHDAMLRGELHDDGSMTAMMGAGVEVDQVIEVAEGADYRLEGLVSSLVRNRADLARDEFGDCKQLSVTLLYDGVSAYLFEDATR